MTIRAKWTGEYQEVRDKGGELLERTVPNRVEGVPAQDLDEDYWQREMTNEQREAVRKSGLYAVKTDAEMKPKASKEGGEGS